MVNKCSVIGCKSLYREESDKLHRFPLDNQTLLSSWKDITGNKSEWNPTKSSRLCCNHFTEDDYLVDHKKGVLKPTSTPSIVHRVRIPRYRRNNRQLYPYYFEHYNEIKDMNKLIKVEYTVQEHDTRHDETGTSTKNIKHNSSYNSDDDDDDDDDMMEYNSSYQHKNDVGNRKNSKNNSTFMSNGTESTEFLISPTENHYESFVNIEEEKKKEIFNDIVSSKLKKQRCTNTIYSLYFKSPKIKRVLKSLNSTDIVVPSFATQVNKLYPYKNKYKTTKHKIKKIIMEAQKQISNLD